MANRLAIIRNGVAGFIDWLVSSILATACLICVLFAANPQDRCLDRYIEFYTACATAQYPDGGYRHSITYCAQHANNVYNSCMRRAQQSGNVSGPVPSPPPLPIINRPPTSVGNASPPPAKSPPPLTGKPIVYPPVTGPVTSKSPTPSPSAPTLLAKPKSTPSPHKDHHH